MRLELDRVTAGYGTVTALRDVCLVVPSGRVVALLGPNGAGKSTLLRVASSLLPPRSGRVLLDGVDVTGLPPDELVRAGVCHITADGGIFGSLTVRENLRLFVDGSDEAEGVSRLAQAFPRLAERLEQVAGTLSGGEQQMLALARARARPFSLVMVDELSTGLAPVVVDGIFAFLAQLAAAGTTILLVEQYVARALDLADMVYVLARGRVVFAGEPPEVTGSDLLAQYLGPAPGRSAAR